MSFPFSKKIHKFRLEISFGFESIPSASCWRQKNSVWLWLGPHWVMMIIETTSKSVFSDSASGYQEAKEVKKKKATTSCFRPNQKDQKAIQNLCPQQRLLQWRNCEKMVYPPFPLFPSILDKRDLCEGEKSKTALRNILYDDFYRDS